MTDYNNVKPIEHFKGQWSIDIDLHAKTARIEKSRLESKELKKGGSDLFLGSREGVIEYVHKTYPNCEVKFVSSVKDSVHAKYNIVAKEPDVTGYKTAMTRSGPSAPLKFLLSKNLIPEGLTVLDYGCGKGADVDHLKKLGYKVVGFDPKWRPEMPTGKFDIILNTFVLNVIDEKSSDQVVNQIKSHLAPNGKIFISVRRDIPKEGQKGKDCWQRWVECPSGFKTIVENKGFATFQLI